MSLFIFSLSVVLTDAIPQCNTKRMRRSYTQLVKITTNCGLWCRARGTFLKTKKKSSINSWGNILLV